MSQPIHSFRRKPLALLVRAGLLSASAVSPAYALNWYVISNGDAATGIGNTGSLRYVFDNVFDGDTIRFDCVALSCPATITLTSQGNNQGFPGPTALSLSGKTLTITADNPGDVVLQAAPGSTSATSLRLFFVDSTATLTLQNLQISGGKAIGGNGGTGGYAGGGAGGLGGAILSQGNLVLANTSLTGNQAVGGNGGSIVGCAACWGGGGGLGGDGGNGYLGGGGGTGGNGYAGGGGTGGWGGPGSLGYGGFGGNGKTIPAGAGQFGGGGGGGYAGGGAGSDGGGGGGGGYGIGGSGGNGGSGGFGGGGGASFNNAGNGGFAGGGGCGFYFGGGTPGFGGGAGHHNSYGSGGGGGGLGGAVFVRSGTLSFQNAGGLPVIGGNGVTGGTGASDGSAFGSGVFLTDASGVAFDLAGGTTTISDTITGNCAETAICTDGGLSKDGAGTLVLSGTDNYNGPTTISAGLLQVDGAVANSPVTVDGALGGIGTVGAITLDGGGTIAPGDSAVGVLNGASLNWNGGGTIDFQIGATGTTIDSDLLNLTGALSNGGGGGFVFNFSAGPTMPAAGTTYTLINYGSATGFSWSDFSAVAVPPLVDLNGTFLLNSGSLQFMLFNVTNDRIFADRFE